MKHVKAALRCARYYGMELEFKEFYRIYRSSGVSPFQAAFYALNDWDLLDLTDDMQSVCLCQRWYQSSP